MPNVHPEVLKIDNLPSEEREKAYRDLSIWALEATKTVCDNNQKLMSAAQELVVKHHVFDAKPN